MAPVLIALEVVLCSLEQKYAEGPAKHVVPLRTVSLVSWRLLIFTVQEENLGQGDCEEDLSNNVEIGILLCPELLT